MATRALAGRLRCHHSTFYLTTTHFGAPLAAQFVLDGTTPSLVYRFHPRGHTRSRTQRRLTRGTGSSRPAHGHALNSGQLRRLSTRDHTRAEPRRAQSTVRRRPAAGAVRASGAALHGPHEVARPQQGNDQFPLALPTTPRHVVGRRPVARWTFRSTSRNGSRRRINAPMVPARTRRLTRRDRNMSEATQQVADQGGSIGNIVQVYVHEHDVNAHFAVLDIRIDDSTVLADIQRAVCTHLDMQTTSDASCYITLPAESPATPLKHFLPAGTTAGQLRSVHIDMEGEDSQHTVQAVSLPGQSTLWFEDIEVPTSDIINLVVPSESVDEHQDASMPSSPGYIHVLRMSSQARWSPRCGCSMVFKVAHTPQATVQRLMHCLAAHLKLNYYKICLFYRQVDYLDDAFSQPMHNRVTRSIFHSLVAGLAPVHHKVHQFTHLYLHVEWSATCSVSSHRLQAIADEIAQTIQNGTSSNTLRSGGGGGRKLRIPRDSVTHNAVESIVQILRRVQSGAGVDDALVKKVLQWEPRVARAVLQARTHGPKLKLFAEALQDMGLACFAGPLNIDADKLMAETPAVDVTQDAPTRPSRAASSAEGLREVASDASTEGSERRPPHHSSGHGQLRNNLDEIEKRVKAIEAWAHEFDAAPVRKEGLSPKQAEQLQARVERHVIDLVGKQVKLLLASKAERACETIFAILPLTKQGLVVEHDLVRALLKCNPNAVDDILHTDIIAQQYDILAKLVGNSGNGRVSEALHQAANTFRPEAAEDEEVRIDDAPRDISPPPTLDYDSPDMEASHVEVAQLQQKPAPKRRGRPPKSASASAPPQAACNPLTKHSAGNTDGERTGDRIEAIEQNIQLLARHARMFSNLEEKVDCLDEQHAAIGEDMMSISASVRQVRLALGMSVPLDRKADFGDNAVTATPVALNLIESKVQSIDQRLAGMSFGTVQACTQTAAPPDLTTMMRKLDAFGVMLNRCIHVSQQSWSSVHTLSARLQIVHDSASLALQQLAGLRAPVGLLPA
eukprot:6455405-Amphidinium_carterae.2